MYAGLLNIGRSAEVTERFSESSIPTHRLAATHTQATFPDDMRARHANWQLRRCRATRQVRERAGSGPLNLWLNPAAARASRKRWASAAAEST